MKRRVPSDRIVGGVALVLLAALAVQLVADLRERGRRDALRRDLVSLAMAQESFHYDRKVYGVDPSELTSWGFRAGAPARIEVVEATTAGWSAVAAHRGSGTRCYLYMRAAAPLGPARKGGVVECA